MCKLIIVVSLLGVIGVTVGQIIQDGQCDPNILLQQNFDIDQFSGLWYEHSRTDHPQGGDCSTIDFTRVDQAVTVQHRTIKENFLEEHFGTAAVEAGTAKLSLNLPQLSNTSLDFWVMLTDNANFALTYSCENVGTTQRRIFLWQLTKGTPFATELMQVLMNNTMINILGINSNDLRQVDHSSEACYTLPEIVANQPVIIPGQCNENITVVQGFDAGRFLGVWHEISSYYSENALGTCSRAQYSSGVGGRVDVVNSQIINQNLFAIEGYATVSSTDNSGRLNVVLEVVPGIFAESELLIIATDYDNWAISYTCNNLNNNQRRIFSWIVSRRRTLSEQSRAEVDAVVNSVLELNNRYYQLTDQTNTGCFYSPQPEFNVPVVFGGQCDENINVVANFNAGAYLNTWYTIESYPSLFQDGTCSTAFYSLDDELGVVIVYNSQVINQTLDEIYGTAVPQGTDAKLIVSFPIAGTNQTIESPLWVISTDYSSYSLAYSCLNLNDYQQQVTVWKLSRTKSLSTNAITQINNAMANVPVLNQQYFQAEDQTPNGCFYFPEAKDGEPVIFPGQCDDDDVPVTPNFNLNLFMGQWYEIEAYPKENQAGQCIEHTFSIAGNTGIMNIVASSVTDQLLLVSNGQMVFTNGTDGRFSMTISTGNGTSITFPFYIISTDYFNYVLAYTCINRGEHFKYIGAWKLSRTKELTNTSAQAIDQVMEDITVLRNDYFEEVDHSADACFYFPDLAPGEPVILPGQCSDVQVKQNFDAASFLGRWRLIESYPSEFQQGTCNQAIYSLGENGTVIVSNNEVRNDSLAVDNGVATLPNDTLGLLLVTFPNAPVPFEYQILDTDYTDYALIYGCVNINTQQRQIWSWKMSRSTTLSSAAVSAINDITSNITVLNNRYYQTVSHSDESCFYYPDLDGSSTVIFRGQCDPNITVVTGFDAVGYMGLWHDVERYPAPFQDGTCGNAFYTLNTDLGIVEVFNTQVLNQTLDTIDGFAVLDHVDANDTSAKLLVTFPVGGFNLTTPYWVLATDYRTYALVYSCTNLNSETRSVTSWKLSRTKELSANASEAINRVVQEIDVLDDRYYIRQDQTPDGCFYVPEPQPGIPVVFPGECDLNVTVEQNFNMSRFEGVWHEIEAYPKDEQPGQCINHEFNLNTQNTMTFNSYNVVAQSLGITSGTVAFTSNDNSAKLSLVFTSNGTRIEIPYWIVSTDYDNHALAYSCVTQPSGDFRGIWSWKLSRSKQLSQASNTAIDSAMADNVVLNNVFFENISQSDDSCFYLPETAPGEPIIFPGQCDTNITGIANFNITAFYGRWRLIESYHSNYQRGTCNQANYSPGENGTIIVSNNVVRNDSLAVINGVATLLNDNIGRLLVTYPTSSALEPFDLHILDTDYTEYALLYGCVNINTEQRRVWSWKMSRSTTLSSAAVSAINNITSNINVLNDRYYQSVSQSDASCFYYPEVDGSSTVIFRGQCDPNITVVTGFDAVGYMGLWHDIERYPAPFQDGTCGNAFYTLDTDLGIVEVFNTQVLNQTLDTIDGFAVLDHVDANDTSAKLLVTFPVGGFNLTTPYWVLATDYTTYALVYSCTNLNSETRSVTSWKLSRTKELSANASEAINRVVQEIDVLDDRYYIRQDQSPDGCFYVPEPQPGVPVVFPGQCDMNATVLQEFNMSRFQGVWHEIEAYPKEEQDGQCINHQFILSTGNTMSFESSNVIAQSLGVTTGTLKFGFNDTTGRLVLEFMSNGSMIEFPYWIVDTDYDNYALVYSCVNKPSGDFRGIWSWKLSRSKQLSQASNTSINSAMADNVALNNIFFETISQSDDSCFYLPETAPGQPAIFPGQCDTNIRGIANFNAAAYLGQWRMIETYASNFQLGTCGDAEYSLNADGSVAVYNTEVINQTLSTINGVATVATTDGTGQLSVQFPDAPFASNYYILDTDYTSYALVYSCFNINNEQRQVFSWKLSRTNSLSQTAQTNINNVVNSINVLDDRYYEVVNRTPEACFYFPEPDPTKPVIYRGQCDQDIQVVTGFDAVRYMGLWHDIERYSAPFQDGTCGNAFYTLNTDLGIVEVFNTQVLNQTLDTIDGFAVLDHVDANDTSAKLLVTFPVGGFNLTSPYWVLATDYTTYALVYSCTNLNSETRTVTSWKLSRTKELSANASEAINRVVQEIDVLDDRYYIRQDQTPDGCFYVPEPQPGVPVVFPGQCDMNATVLQEFNMSRFQGVWHEIEAYPKEEQDGQCINHQFILSNDNTMSFESSNVIAQSLGVTTGTLKFGFNDTTGRLVLEFMSNGSIIEFPYWIVDTDYDNYALVYSCVDKPSGDFRGIWSWKLSRSKQLSQASNTSINSAMANNVALNNVFFETISQSDDSCFYLPETAPGQPAIFPGQCDTNIRGIANFNAAAYLGQWRMIETYASNFQLGTCGDAEYSLNADGSVAVYNTEVINQTLSTINGVATVATTDGTGQLSVQFPDAPVASNYYILDTDYTSYALVYSCFNINNEQRQVFSWKLSRTNSLSQTAQTNINNVVNSINVLDDRYYEVVDRTPEACFYFPEPDPTKPVIYRGQCDQDIQVVTGFDAVRYSGVWYDIESYPAPFQIGTCGTADYDLDLNTLVVSVENTQVINQQLDVQIGTAVLATNDSSAKLLVTFEVNGQNITTDYWVLATDYDNVALVYSCQNINDEYRQVNSWMLSRRQNLTAADRLIIASAIANVTVLEERYYVEGGHTDEDCFYYPDNEGGDVILDGECVPDLNVAAITNFSASAFTGTWHEVARFPSDLQTGECVAADYSVNAQNTITITATAVENEFQNASIIPGSMSVDGRGVITAQIEGLLINTFYILDTDYTEYALLYGCRNAENGTKQVFSWKLSRSRSGLSVSANATINSIVSTNVDLFEGYYSYTDQSNNACFHYPEFEELPPTIELPGPCDESIQGVANFNAANYLGRWIEIKRYPQTDQFGTCDRAYYSLGNGGVVDVRNTQVINTTLAEQLGYAVVVETGNSWYLNVTFVVQGITVHANYYVLATDYNNYALVYSCRNLANGNRQVYSWKLSRTMSFSAQANAAINAAIEQTQGLSQNYYKTTSQSEADCFYIPEVQPNVAPVFRGQCEDISGVANFDAQRYAGWWHEIERYPVDGGTGECVSSQYQGLNNAYQVVNTFVSNGTATVVTNSVRVTNDGKLIRTLANGNEETIVVMATDYNTYALLYSCESFVDENNDQYRRVWSTKHSKTRELSAAAEVAFAPLIESHPLLYSQFYQKVDQSDAACFHYPPAGQQVILPGQCDNNIPVQEDFDVAAYGGTWYQIERYPQIHENATSTCIGARYILNSETGVVSVLNWEVIDGVLETIEGNATLSSSDGSAKLIVMLPVVGTENFVSTSLYVLKTDYTDYSLAYSCSNINTFQRSIGAWKLSRRRALSPEGNDAITQHMSTRQELHQPYFISVGQDEGCQEPSSGALLKSSVVVMLICAVWQMLS